jgi:hypothetical protein
MSKRTKILVMDLKETEARNNCAGEGQQQFNQPTDLRQQADIIQNHENCHVRSIGQGEAKHRKYKRLKLGSGQAYDLSSWPPYTGIASARPTQKTRPTTVPLSTVVVVYSLSQKHVYQPFSSNGHLFRLCNSGFEQSQYIYIPTHKHTNTCAHLVTMSRYTLDRQTDDYPTDLTMSMSSFFLRITGIQKMKV